MCAALESGEEEAVQTLTRAGATGNNSQEDFSDTSSVAFRNGHEQMMNMLLTSGAHFKIETKLYRELFRQALEKGHDKAVGIPFNSGDMKIALLVALLIEAGAIGDSQKDSNKILRWAFSRGSEETTEVLITSGTHINIDEELYKELFHYAHDNGQREIVEVLLTSGDGKNASYAASYLGREGMVQKLLEFGTDIKADLKLLGAALSVALSNTTRR